MITAAWKYTYIGAFALVMIFLGITMWIAFGAPQPLTPLQEQYFGTLKDLLYAGVGFLVGGAGAKRVEAG